MKSIDPVISGITATVPGMVKSAASMIGHDTDMRTTIQKKHGYT
jgi:hypothetical protein